MWLVQLKQEQLLGHQTLENPQGLYSSSFSMALVTAH